MGRLQKIYDKKVHLEDEFEKYDSIWKVLDAVRSNTAINPNTLEKAYSVTCSLRDFSLSQLFDVNEQLKKAIKEYDEYDLKNGYLNNEK